MMHRYLLAYVLAPFLFAPEMPAQPGPVLEPPALKDPSQALLAAKVAESFHDWSAFQPNLLADLFTRPADAVVHDLEIKKARMERYKKSEQDFYTELLRDSQRDLDNLRAMGQVDWSRYRKEQPEVVLREIGMMREQELRIGQQAEELAGRTDRDSVQHRTRLEIERQAVVGARHALADSLADMAAATGDPEAAKRSAIHLLEERLTQLKHLDDLTARSRAALAAVYSDAENAVKSEAARRSPKPPSASPPGTVSATGQPPGGAAAAAPRPDGSTSATFTGVIRSAESETRRGVAGPLKWVGEDNGADGKPFLIEFQILDWSTPQPTAVFQLWLGSTYTERAIDLSFNCRVEGAAIDCHSTANEAGTLALTSQALIKGRPPVSLMLNATVKRDAGGVWSTRGTRMTLRQPEH